MYSVDIDSTGQRFTATPERSVLQAALGAGIALPYGCSNGTCGDCRARLLAGEVERIAHSDYVLSAAERAAGVVLLCCMAARSDLVIQVASDTSAAQLPEQALEVRLHGIAAAADSAWVVRLTTPRSRLLRYLSGQRVWLQVDDGPGAALALASCPCEGRHLQVHVRRDGSDFERSLVALRRNARLTLRGPYGAALLDESSSRPIVLLALDTGFATAQALLAQIINLELEQPVTVLWYASGAMQHYLENYCRSLRDALDAFRYLPLAGPDCAPSSLRQALAGVSAEVDWAASDTYLCTAAGSDVAGLRALLLELGAPASRLFGEAW